MDEDKEKFGNKSFKVNWELRMIFISSTITNKDLIEMFMEITNAENQQRIVDDGPFAEWKILTFIIHN